MPFEQDVIVHRAVEHLICPTEGFIRIATSADAEILRSFINNAYIKNRSMYEPKYLTNRVEKIEEIHRLMDQGIFLLLTASGDERTNLLDDGCSIVASVFIHHVSAGEVTIQRDSTSVSAKINMLTVHPAMVNRGIARYMMQVVDAVAKAFHYSHISLTVLSCYQHLLDMYTKWGFNIVGTMTLADCGVNPDQFPNSSHIVVMEKSCYN